MKPIDRILELAKQREISQKELADKIGVSPGNITDWKNGRSNPTQAVIVKIADFFDVPTDFILKEPDRIDIWVNAIKIWANNKFFSESETKAIEEHFAEFCLRYKLLVNSVCDARTGRDENISDDEFNIIKENSRHEAKDLVNWASLVPEYFYDKSPNPENKSFEPTSVEDDIRSALIKEGILKENRPLTEDEQKAILSFAKVYFDKEI